MQYRKRRRLNETIIKSILILEEKDIKKKKHLAIEIGKPVPKEIPVHSAIIRRRMIKVKKISKKKKGGTLNLSKEDVEIESDSGEKESHVKIIHKLLLSEDT